MSTIEGTKTRWAALTAPATAALLLALALPGMTDQQARDEALTLFLAGQDSTAADRNEQVLRLAVAVAAPLELFAMPSHHGDCRGSTFPPVAIRVAVAGEMVGPQEPGELVAKSRRFLV